MTKPIITINELDAERLDALLEQPAFANTDVAAALNDELIARKSCRRRKCRPTW